MSGTMVSGYEWTRGSSSLITCFLQSFTFPREILQEFSISAGEAVGRGKVELS